MKKNLTLFSILCFLLLFTYYFVEKEEQEKFEEKKSKAGILNLENVSKLGYFLKLKAPSWEMVKKEKEEVKKEEKEGKKKEKNEFQADSDQENLYAIEGLEETNQVKAHMVVDIISGLSLVESIPQNSDLEEEFFPPDLSKHCLTFVFEHGDIEFCLGVKLKFNRNFYAKIKKQGQTMWGILTDPSADDFVFHEEEGHNSSEKYERLLAILKLDKEFFRE